MAKPNGAILYRGPSLLDGADIVVIAIGTNSGSENRKTGRMLQTYILRADALPAAVVRTGNDSSICGDCTHRGDGTGKGRTCYVNVGQGPTMVYKSWVRGIYPDATTPDAIASIGKNKLVRLGTYGDPAAVPVHVWRALVSQCTGNTGYTHQWKNQTGAELKSLCMASVDSPDEYKLSASMGWRSFRVAMPSDPVKIAGERACPASAEAGKKVLCEQCMACAGARPGRVSSIVIQAHGGTAVMANVKRRMAA